MSPKKKRKVSKGTARRYTSTRPDQPAAQIRRQPPPPSYAEKSLRQRIQRFAFGARFRDEFEAAFSKYMGPDAIQLVDGQKTLLVNNQDEIPGYQEWFTFDYRLPSGERIIDLFLHEEGPRLSASQRKILDEWLPVNRQRLLETLSVEPGVGETVQDLLNGEVLRLNDISFSYFARPGMLFLARPLLTEGHWHFTGSGLRLTAQDKPRILAFAQEEWQAYQQAHPQADLLDFYRDASLALRIAALKILAEEQESQDELDEELSPEFFAIAEFTLKGERRSVERALDRSAEFELADEETEGEFAGSAHYVWVAKRRASLSEPEEDDDGLPEEEAPLPAAADLAPAETSAGPFGDVYVSWDAVILLCPSLEDLEAGKELLYRTLGTRIQLREDDLQDLRPW